MFRISSYLRKKKLQTVTEESPAPYRKELLDFIYRKVLLNTLDMICMLTILSTDSTVRTTLYSTIDINTGMYFSTAFN